MENYICNRIALQKQHELVVNDLSHDEESMLSSCQLQVKIDQTKIVEYSTVKNRNDEQPKEVKAVEILKLADRESMTEMVHNEASTID